MGLTSCNEPGAQGTGSSGRRGWTGRCSSSWRRL